MSIVFDIIALLGLGLLGYGIWLFDPRVSYIIVGVIMMSYAVFGAWKNAANDQETETSEGDE